MPFGSYEASAELAYANAARLLKETGAQAMKVEAAPPLRDTVASLVDRGIPVMGHVGLCPQAVNIDGKFRAKGRTKEERATSWPTPARWTRPAPSPSSSRAWTRRSPPKSPPPSRPHHRHRRLGQVRRADPGDRRYAGVVRLDPEIRPPLRRSETRSIRRPPPMQGTSGPAVFLPQPRPMHWPAASRSAGALPGDTKRG